VLPTDLGLRSFLMLHLTIEARDDVATRQALREVAETMPDRDGHRIVNTLRQTLPPEGQRWLASLR
jgi:hypothetical protein